MRRRGLVTRCCSRMNCILFELLFFQLVMTPDQSCCFPTSGTPADLQKCMVHLPYGVLIGYCTWSQLYGSFSPSGSNPMQICKAWPQPLDKQILTGTPNREPQRYSRNITGIYLPRPCLRVVPCLGFPVRSLDNRASEHFENPALGSFCCTNPGFGEADR